MRRRDVKRRTYAPAWPVACANWTVLSKRVGDGPYYMGPKSSLPSISLDHFISHSLFYIYTLKVGPRHGYKIGQRPLAKNDLHIILYILHHSIAPILSPKPCPNICFGERPMPLLSAFERNHENTSSGDDVSRCRI
jgi:hypothetical protein